MMLVAPLGAASTAKASHSICGLFVWNRVGRRLAIQPGLIRRDLTTRRGWFDARYRRSLISNLAVLTAIRLAASRVLSIFKFN
jgi:hypothetical protein